MVAKITSPHSIKRALNYNEKKVQSGQATRIYAGNFLKDLYNLNIYDKLKRFQDLISLNDRAQKSNTLHISLNFHPSEKLNNETLTSIAKEYMLLIGFGEQPYLVYEHRDSGHPHVHIVTTNIEADGKRIDTYNIGKLKSEIARKEIEKKFELVRADNPVQTWQRTSEIRKIEYGKIDSKRAITNILDQVVSHYNFNSLQSLNAILKTFNVMADKGKEGGRVSKFKGLSYCILDQNGKKVGVPIKASSLYSKPTFERLEKLFKINESKRGNLRQLFRNRIHSNLNTKSFADFIANLKKFDIDTVLRKNEMGLVYGITFVDHLSKAVFNGSELGREFSAAAILNKFLETKSITTGSNKPIAKVNTKSHLIKRPKVTRSTTSFLQANSNNCFLKELLKTEHDDAKLLSPLLTKRRKKKRKPLL